MLVLPRLLLKLVPVAILVFLFFWVVPHWLAETPASDPPSASSPPAKIADPQPTDFFRGAREQPPQQGYRPPAVAPNWTAPAPPMPASATADERMIALPAGVFEMGNNSSPRPDERPAHRVRVAAFKLDRHEVTNAEFARFVAATRYRTSAEAQGAGNVFDRRGGQWLLVPGADWLHPDGPASTIQGREQDPVVQVSWIDASNYARWAHLRLPTEAEWEYAARGGLAGGEFPWGQEELVRGAHQANYWQGSFPQFDRGSDGYRYLAPVSSFMPNRFGLVDMAGNVREWCQDWYGETTYRRASADNPTGPRTGQTRVCRGGSWLAGDNSFEAIKVHARDYALPDQCANDIGFRCAAD